MLLKKSILAALRTSAMVAASLFALHAAADPARLDGMRLAGHEPVDPALKRFSAKVTSVGPADKNGRVSKLHFEPIGPGMTPPKPDEMQGWRLTFIRGKMFARTLWLQSNTADELTVRDTDPSIDGVVEGDIIIIELIDPNLVDPNA